MTYTFYVVCEPGLDRPCFFHTPPVDYQRKPGAKIYQAEVDLPDFEAADGRLTAKLGLELVDVAVEGRCACHDSLYCPRGRTAR